MDRQEFKRSDPKFFEVGNSGRVGHARVGAAQLGRQRLVEQVTGMVRWRECVDYMAQGGVTRFYEVGAGKVLSGLVKRIAAGATATAVGTPEDIRAFTAARAA